MRPSVKSSIDMWVESYAQRVAAYSGRNQFANLARIGREFKAEFEGLNAEERADIALKCDGVPSGKMYARGWLGAWDRMIDGDAGLVGDVVLRSSSVKRAVQHAPILDALEAMGRADAAPHAAIRSCLTFTTAMNAMNAAYPDRRDAAAVALATALANHRDEISVIHPAPNKHASMDVLASAGA